MENKEIIKTIEEIKPVLDEGFAPANFNWYNLINEEDLKAWWQDIFGGAELSEGTTIRITGPSFFKNKHTGEFDGKPTQTTFKTPVRNVDDLKAFIKKQVSMTARVEDQMNLGFSMSASVFNTVIDDRESEGYASPSAQSFNATRKFILDLDSFSTDVKGTAPELDENGKEIPRNTKDARFHFNSLKEGSKLFSAILLSNMVNQGAAKKSVPMPFSPASVYETGGGLQLHYNFNEFMQADTAKNTYDLFKYLLPKKEDKFRMLGTPDCDIMGDATDLFFEFDPSSMDITHTQRISGTMNPKAMYNKAFAKPMELPQNRMEIVIKEMEELINDLSDVWILKNIDFTFRDKRVYPIDIIKKFSMKTQMGAAVSSSPDGTNTNGEDFFLDCKQILKVELHDIIKEYKLTSDLTGVQVIDAQAAAGFGRFIPKMQETIADAEEQLFDPSFAMIKSFLLQLTPEQQLELFEEKVGLPVKKTSKYTAYNCPFHPEKDPSFAIYPNSNGILIARDFHVDDKEGNFNVISFLTAHSCLDSNEDAPKTAVRVISELSSRFGIKLSNAQQKEIGKSQKQDAASRYIAEINRKDQVYYRKANRQRDCIIRNYNTGKGVTFDGSRMLTDHVLMHQLGVQAPDMILRTEFHDLFVEKILISAFEEFSPGKGQVFEVDHINYVNTWIPGKNYSDIMELAGKLDPMDIPSAIELIKETLPASYYFLCQLTQKGSMAYFVNWLACNAKFKTLPALPVITSVQGLGKNVFVKEWMEVFLNHEYVNVITSDKVTGQFNSFMETSSLIVLDEGDFNTTKDVDQLKFYTGNDWLQVEKKGVDMVKKKKHFNFIILTNGDTPLRHPNDDRRTTYFRGDVSLMQSIQSTEYDDIKHFIDCLRLEVKEFWAIIANVKLNSAWEEGNLKNNQFNKQILKMHPFGKLVIQLIEEDWDTISVQLNENVTDEMIIKSNSEMIASIRKSFYEQGYISLTMINKYIHSLNYKSFVGVQDFINRNSLDTKGIRGEMKNGTIVVHIDRHKLDRLIHMDSNLGLLFPEYKNDKYEDTIKRLKNELGSRDNEASIEEGSQMIGEGLVQNDNSSTNIVQDNGSYLHNEKTQFAPGSVKAPTPKSPGIEEHAFDEYGLPKVPEYK